MVSVKVNDPIITVYNGFKTVTRFKEMWMGGGGERGIKKGVDVELLGFRLTDG